MARGLLKVGAVNTIIAPDNATQIFSARDPRGSEYGMFLCFYTAASTWHVAHDTDGYSMTFADTDNFNAWARSTGATFVQQ